MTQPLDEAREESTDAPSRLGYGFDASRWPLALSFGLGLLLGWLLLGWWLFPVGYEPATPAHLDPAHRDDYLRLVASDFARSTDLSQASDDRATLSDLQVGTSLRRLSQQPDPVGAEARSLAEALAIDLDDSDVVAAAAAEASAAAAAPADGLDPSTDDGAPALPGAAADDPGQRDWQSIWRWISVLALAGAIVAAGLLALFWWRMRQDDRSAWRPARREPSPEEPDQVAVPGGRGVGRAGRDQSGDWQGPQPATAGSGRDASMEATSRMPAQRAEPADRGAGRSGPKARRSGSSAPAWQPERIELGQTVDAVYRADEGQDGIRTWLVYDRRGALVGGAGLMEQSIGGVKTLDLWFSDRDDVDQTSRTPTVTFVTERAHGDPVLRARLSDRLLVPTIPGKTTRLQTVDLELDVEVVSAETSSPQHPSLGSVVLALTPRALPGTGLHRAVAERSRFENDDPEAPDAAWDPPSDEEIDQAFDAPGRSGPDAGR